MKIITTLFLLFITINCLAQPKQIETELISDNNLFEASIIQVYPDAFPEISVIFQSKNKEGNPLWLDNKDDIGIIENGNDCEVVRLQNISERKTLNIGIVLDHSGSMASHYVYQDVLDENGNIMKTPQRLQVTTGPIEYAKNGVNEFLKTETSDKDSILFVGFNSKINHIVDLTTDYKKIKSEVDKIKAGGGTAFVSTLYKTINKLSKTDTRSVIVSLTDGVDSSTEEMQEALIEHANEKGIAIYIIGLGNVNTALLNKIATETNGFYYPTDSPEALVEIYATIKEQIKAIYQLDYISSNHDVREIDRDLQFYFKNDTMAFASASGTTFYELPEKVQNYIVDENIKRLDFPTDKKHLFGGILFSLLVGIGTFTLYRKGTKKTGLTINKAYPNPFENFITLNIDIENPDLITELRIVSVDGRIVKTKILDPSINIFTIYTRELQSGFYSLQVSNSEGTSVIENIVKK